ncbi:hypothetical protein PCL_12586 [Purpureocillium lilacinum]|uniref:Uncharacterized protein n=1 Tax=Purpureocillium lilacinum TaxID=33203 RepID=A0A2U3E9N8_PURLI|nr:hypothetical protein PCL_12586 [Purpureocillium lilacinum]
MHRGHVDGGCGCIAPWLVRAAMESAIKPPVSTTESSPSLALFISCDIDIAVAVAVAVVIVVIVVLVVIAAVVAICRRPSACRRPRIRLPPHLNQSRRSCRRRRRRRSRPPASRKQANAMPGHAIPHVRKPSILPQFKLSWPLRPGCGHLPYPPPPARPFSTPPANQPDGNWTLSDWHQSSPELATACISKVLPGGGRGRGSSGERPVSADKQCTSQHGAAQRRTQRAQSTIPTVNPPLHGYTCILPNTSLPRLLRTAATGLNPHGFSWIGRHLELSDRHTHKIESQRTPTEGAVRDPKIKLTISAHPRPSPRVAAATSKPSATIVHLGRRAAGTSAPSASPARS